jgi:hypothetical protein
LKKTLLLLLTPKPLTCTLKNDSLPHMEQNYSAESFSTSLNSAIRVKASVAFLTRIVNNYYQYTLTFFFCRVFVI